MTSANEQNSDQATGPAHSVTSEGADAELQTKKIEELEIQVKEKDGKYLYLYADFENFKKRSIKERSDLMKFGWEPQARELLQSVDNLERAVSHIPNGTDKALSDGLSLVLSQFKTTLSKFGVEPIECVEKPFDPNFHEAVAQEVSSLPEGSLVRELSKGYTLNGRLLRASRVSISKGPAQE